MSTKAKPYEHKRYKQTSGIVALGSLLWIALMLAIVWILPYVAIKAAFFR